jgi:hypothetical protein
LPSQDLPLEAMEERKVRIVPECHLEDDYNPIFSHHESIKDMIRKLLERESEVSLKLKRQKFHVSVVGLVHGMIP